MNRHPLACLAMAGLVAAAAPSLTAAEGSCPSGSCPIIATQAGDAGLSAIHDCGGLNVCKGLGGCKITQDDLNEFATKRGVPAAQAGTAHACAGLNACKGLGGCKVTSEKFVKLFEKRRVAEMAAAKP